MKAKHRRRLVDLEARIAALETRGTAWTDMPAAVNIDLDPKPPLDPRPATALAADWWDDDDDGYRTGVYL